MAFEMLTRRYIWLIWTLVAYVLIHKKKGEKHTHIRRRVIFRKNVGIIIQSHSLIRNFAAAHWIHDVVYGECCKTAQENEHGEWNETQNRFQEIIVKKEFHAEKIVYSNEESCHKVYYIDKNDKIHQFCECSCRKRSQHLLFMCVLYCLLHSVRW